MRQTSKSDVGFFFSCAIGVIIEWQSTTHCLVIPYLYWPIRLMFNFVINSLVTDTEDYLICHYCPPLSRKRGDIKSHFVRLSVCLSVRLSQKTLTLAITFALLQIELWYLACVFLVTRPFRWYHVVTLTVTFDLLQGQICCRAGDHNSLNLLVKYWHIDWKNKLSSNLSIVFFHCSLEIEICCVVISPSVILFV